MLAVTTVPVTASRKLKRAAIITAARQERVRVPITVAIAFAESLEPFAIPKPMAAAVTRISTAGDSGILQYYTFKDIGYILTPVGGVLHVLVEFTPFDYLARIRAVMKQLR